MSFRFMTFFRSVFVKRLKKLGEKEIPTQEEFKSIITDLDDIFTREGEEGFFFTDEIELVQSIYYDIESFYRGFEEKKEIKAIFNNVKQLRKCSIDKAHKFGRARELTIDIYNSAKSCRAYDEAIEKLRKGRQSPDEKKRLFKFLERVTLIMKRVRNEEYKLEEAINTLQNKTKIMRKIISSMLELKAGSKLSKGMLLFKSIRPVLFKKAAIDLDDLKDNLIEQKERMPIIRGKMLHIRRKIKMLEKREKKVLELIKAA